MRQGRRRREKRNDKKSRVKKNITQEGNEVADRTDKETSK
jgi:hypothetical protein